MKIKHEFNYDADCHEIADEFTEHDSAYQAQALNSIGWQFKIWSRNNTKHPATYTQLLEIAEDLDDNGKWFINILHDYTEGMNNNANT